MKKLVVSNHPPRRLTVLAALLAALAAAQPALAAPADVVISQLYGAGGNNGAAWNRDFIELFNRSSGPVSLSGMSVQYQSATGTTWQATALPNVTLQPGQYFLVGGASGGSAGTDIGPVDQAGTLNLSATTGKVALSRIAAAMGTADGAPNVIDLVGFGGANRFETAVAPAPSNTTSIQRAALGCTDTDNNAADFSAGPVAGPRRSTSPANACGGGGGPVLQPIVPNCPASLQARQGSASSAALSATDQDSIVNSAVISAGAAPGITLAGFAPATGPGAAASVTLQVGASVAAGTYPVVVQFGNDSAQSASCTVSVRVAGTLAIPQIQGSAATSPYANTVQTTQGVVTAKISGGFFIQDLNGDGDPGTSDGLFVFGASTAAAVGDMVRVTGTVTEYKPSGATRSYTEIAAPTEVTRIGGGYTIAPTNIELPNSDLARYEGMLVRFITPLTVNQNAYLGDRGELVLAYGRREVPTNRYPAGSPEAKALAAANAANIVVLDDGIFTTPDQIPYLGQDGTVRSGDLVTDLTGVLDYGAIGGGYTIAPTNIE
ncbi:MAG: lamin tail domain-containing protein, partial [Massilia sp.]